ncbi:MAG: hypothetical protein HY785_15790 [Oscillatoriophycideae cyanobacterium NC_groundwater_1537_Pr4_S-0.65um_50_18]|nr:hypothetical protein [Oscillatoriophycideae cyanobacterium NC_groundwater_1537_Pr4_S-0.65um_50_18]
MAQTDQIQALIQEIDEVLSKTSPRLPWVMSTDAMRQRQVLEQARGCLAKLQIPADGAIDSTAGLLPSGQPAAESAQQVLQAVLQEMTYLRVNMLQPMRSDVDLLRQQREALTQEIRQLEAQRQQYVLPQQNNPQLLMEFLQSAMGQMQESLRGQVTQMVASLAVEGLAEPPLLHSAESPHSENLAIASLSPAQRLEQIQRVQTQSDQLLLKLDSTLQVIFESLQNNIQSYQESLEQGLSRMHGLGQQGEVMFSALVSRLAEQLGKEATVYLQSQAQSQSQVAPQIPERDRPSLAAKESFNENADTEITRLLEELNALDSTQSQPSEPIPLDTRWQPQPFTLKVDNPESASLEALDQELQQLDLSAVPLDLDISDDEDDDLTFFQETPEFPFPRFSSEDATQIQNLDPEVSPFSPNDLPPDARVAAPTDTSEDLESALDLLNQLSAEAEIAPASHPLEQSTPEGRDLVNLDAVPEAIDAAATTPPLIDSPDALYEDEFYQSLFGEGEGESQSTILDAFELDTENESVQSLDLNEWFEAENLPAPQTPPAAIENPQPATQTESASPAEPAEAAAPLAADIDAPNEDAPNEDIFGGMADPAVQPIQDATADFLPDFAIAPVPQTVENFLLSDPEPPIEPASALAETPVSPIEEDLFWELTEEMQTEPAVNSLPAEAPVNTIAALTDLISTYASVPETSTSEPDTTEASETVTYGMDALWAEGALQSELEKGQADANPDAFEPAQPGEDLLISATPPETAIANFEIGEDTLQQLTADLSSLEIADSGAAQQAKAEPRNAPQSNAPQSTDLWSDFSGEPPQEVLEDPLADPLADLYLAETPPEEAIGHQANQIANAITLEDLLFTDELDAFMPEASGSPEISLFEESSEISSQPTDSQAYLQSAAEETSPEAKRNAFTLEGLDALFEGLPAAPKLETPEPETPKLETPEPEVQPKKKT